MNTGLEIRVWTIQISQWRLAKKEEIDFLDITAKSGIYAFAPRFEYVMKYKRGEITQEEYTRLYLERMKLSLIKLPNEWLKLKDHAKVALACYCKPGVFCHRHLFLPLMADYLKEKGITVIPCGELEKEKTA